MIRRIFSDLPTFKEYELNPGFNLIVADKTKRSTEQDTRNRAGKSSLVEIVHFALGASCKSDSLFRQPAIVDNYFGIELDLNGVSYEVRRSGSAQSKIVVETEAADSLASPLKTTKGTPQPHLTLDRWTAALGQQMFSLAVLDDGKRDPDEPSFRSLFPYFARREGEGGFARPEYFAKDQQAGASQIALSFLLGLEWRLPQEWEEVRSSERTLEGLGKAAKDPVFKEVLKDPDELYAQIALTEESVRELRDQLSEFLVVPGYRDVERRVNEVREEMTRLRDQNTMDRQVLADVEAAIAMEEPPALPDVQRIYREAGVSLPGTVTRRFEDVVAFHRAVIENRRLQLEADRHDASNRIAKREASLEALQDRHTELMRTLEAGGALEERDRLREELMRREASLEALKNQRSIAEKISQGRANLSMRRGQLARDFRVDLQERDEERRRAVLAFGEVSGLLYQQQGELKITVTENGPRFEAKIHGQKSKGVNNMKIFCFDMMLMHVMASRGMGPGFLVHDSHLFDGVDTRQVRRALRIGAELAERLGFQYVVTMNTDDVPAALDGFDPSKYIVEPRLTDVGETGGLFGMRFG